MPPKRLKQSPTRIGDLFSGVMFTMVPLGDLKGNVRRTIVRDRLIENGATEYTNQPESCPIVLADLAVDIELIRKHVRDPNAKIVDVRWVTDSLLANHKLDLEEYLPLWDEPVKHVENDSKEDQVSPKHVDGKSLNDSISNMFEELESMVSTSPQKVDQFRAMAYRRAAAAVRKYRHAINSVSDAEELRSQIGHRSFEKIVEFLETGSMHKAEYLRADPTVIARNELMGIWGVGPSKAEELIESGITSVDQLKSMSDVELHKTLNHNQRLGLMYYDDLLPKMPRTEVEEIVEIIQGSIYQLFDGSSDRLKCIVCGSYRRGSAYCSDADLLLYWDNAEKKTAQETLHLLVHDLTDKGYMLAHFNKENHGSIFLGIFRAHPERPARRVDLKVWSKKSLPFALMHFTGNADFNRRIRLFAKRHGFKLTDTQLIKGDVSIECESEKDVFEALGLRDIPPEDRTSSVDLVSLSTGQSVNLS